MEKYRCIATARLVLGAACCVEGVLVKNMREVYVERRMREIFKMELQRPIRKRRDLTLDPFSIREFLAPKCITC